MVNYRNNKIYDFLKYFWDLKNYVFWVGKGKPSPPPHIVKINAVKKYAKTYTIKVFIETGTFFGAMVYAVKNNFKKLYSIELNENLYEKAKERFKKHNHIKILKGDSGKILPSVLSKVNLPSLFWLDGHYSGGITAMGKKETPIRKELKHILNHRIKGHVILIDDALCFVGKRDYPSLNEVKKLIEKNGVGYTFEVKDNIIRISPSPDKKHREKS